VLLQITSLNRPAILEALRELREAPNSPFKTSKLSLVLLVGEKLVTISNAELRRQEATTQKINTL
jgi:hypothetical protein